MAPTMDRLRPQPAFLGGDCPWPPEPAALPARELYYRLVNVDEHPEILPLAYDFAVRRLDAVDDAWSALAASPDAGGVAAIVDRLVAARPADPRPWRGATDTLARRRALHQLLQYAPTALVDGCWLQCGVLVSIAHTPVGATLSALYAHQVRAHTIDPRGHFAAAYVDTASRLGVPLGELSSRSFAERADVEEGSLLLPIFLLALARYTRTFAGEVLGLNLAWQHLDLSSFGPALLRDVCHAHGLTPPSGDLDDAHGARARALARDAVTGYLRGAPGQAWEAVVRGAAAGVAAWSEWLGRSQRSAPSGPADPRREMIALLRRKAPHAVGYHHGKRLGPSAIDDLLREETFDGDKALDDLARSRWIKPGQSHRSGMIRHLVAVGGPMVGVFSPTEIEVIARWIDSLPPRRRGADDEPEAAAGDTAAEPIGAPRDGAPAGGATTIEGSVWSVESFAKRSAELYGRCTPRELFYHLVNVEDHPDILPVAERFARDRLERSMAMSHKGERPIPSVHYDPAALETWVHEKHRAQVDSYRPPGLRPPVSRESFVDATVQLAPIILIDGGWLQGIASPPVIHTTLGRMLFHVMIEEIGAGEAAEHHANIYRDLLTAMGETAPPVDSWEFARWDRLRDASFEVPALWLSVSCFPRHFLPEIIGLNLAVELAGIGGPYMEARDALKGFGYPTLFVEVHNAADNVAAGHSAWALRTIRRYMDEVAEREGPHAVDPTWHRVWAGVRSTLPQIGRVRLLAHRIGRRLFGDDLAAPPRIFGA